MFVYVKYLSTCFFTTFNNIMQLIVYKHLLSFIFVSRTYIVCILNHFLDIPICITRFNIHTCDDTMLCPNKLDICAWYGQCPLL